MKAMTWLKLGGCALVALAALAAADTRYVEVTGATPWKANSHVIADREHDGCGRSHQAESAEAGCCEKKTAQPLPEKHSGCCPK